jgi:hypothetical protein
VTDYYHRSFFFATQPAHAQQNDVSLEVTPFKGILALIVHDRKLFCSFPSTLSDQLPFLQHYPISPQNKSATLRVNHQVMLWEFYRQKNPRDAQRDGFSAKRPLKTGRKDGTLEIIHACSAMWALCIEGNDHE